MALELVASLRDARDSLRHSPLALSFPELEGEEEENGGRSGGRKMQWNGSLVFSQDDAKLSL